MATVDGKVLLTKDLGTIQEGQHTFELDLSDHKWTMGVYFLTIETERGQVTKKVMKITR